MAFRHVEVSGKGPLELILEAALAGKGVVLTRRGRPRAVVVAATDMTGWAETSELLADPRALREIRTAERQLRRGKSKSFEAVFGKKPRHR